jgi:hypothetical protein
VRTDFNGGFASVRSRPWGGFASLGTPACRGVRLCVRGDGRTYKLTLKVDDSYDGISFQADFPTDDCTSADASTSGRQGADGWQAVDLPWAVFKPVFRGRVVPDAPPLAAVLARPGGPSVRQLGVMVSKFSDSGGLTAGFAPGEFRLLIRAVSGLCG